MSRVEVALPLGAELGEAPVWDVNARVLHLLDILGRKIHRFDPAAGTVRSIQTHGTPGALALREDGGYLAGIDLDFATVDAEGTVERLATVPAGDRFNDGKCDPRGRFLAGTMAPERPESSALYGLDLDGNVTERLTGVTLSNGFDWSATGERFYFVDTPLERIDVFDYDLDTGRLDGRRVFVDLRDVPGRPDGLTVDAEGGVWVAMARGGTVRRYDSAGRPDAVLDFPVPTVTSCTFGGRNLDELFVTSSKALLPPEQQTDHPLAGHLFVATDLGVRGRPPTRYRGGRGV